MMEAVDKHAWKSDLLKNKGLRVTSHYFAQSKRKVAP